MKLAHIHHKPVSKFALRRFSFSYFGGELHRQEKCSTHKLLLATMADLGVSPTTLSKGLTSSSWWVLSISILSSITYVIFSYIHFSCFYMAGHFFIFSWPFIFYLYLDHLFSFRRGIRLFVTFSQNRGGTDSDYMKWRGGVWDLKWW